MPKSRLLSSSNTAARLLGYAAATRLLSLSHKEGQTGGDANSHHTQFRPFLGHPQLRVVAFLQYAVLPNNPFITLSHVGGNQTRYAWL